MSEGMTLGDAQRDLSRRYVGGAPGVLVSGVVWIVAGVVASRHGVLAGFAALFVGGMAIYPLSLLLSRALARGAAPVATANPLERAALEGTFVLFAGLLLAWLLLPVAPGLVFVAAALAIGVRYLSFRTLYGNALYWALGGTIAALATVAGLGSEPVARHLPVLVGVVEIAFATALLAAARRAA